MACGCHLTSHGALPLCWSEAELGVWDQDVMHSKTSVYGWCFGPPAHGLPDCANNVNSLTTNTVYSRESPEQRKQGQVMFQLSHLHRDAEGDWSTYRDNFGQIGIKCHDRSPACTIAHQPLVTPPSCSWSPRVVSACRYKSSLCLQPILSYKYPICSIPHWFKWWKLLCSHYKMEHRNVVCHDRQTMQVPYCWCSAVKVAKLCLTPACQKQGPDIHWGFHWCNLQHLCGQIPVKCSQP